MSTTAVSANDMIGRIVEIASGGRYLSLERGSPFVLCAPNHKSVGVLWPVDGHHRQAARMDAQLRASQPLRKRLWKSVVQAKLRMQAAARAHFNLPDAPLRRMA